MVLLMVVMALLVVVWLLGIPAAMLLLVLVMMKRCQLLLLWSVRAAWMRVVLEVVRRQRGWQCSGVTVAVQAAPCLRGGRRRREPSCCSRRCAAVVRCSTVMTVLWVVMVVVPAPSGCGGWWRRGKAADLKLLRGRRRSPTAVVRRHPSSCSCLLRQQVGLLLLLRGSLWLSKLYLQCIRLWGNGVLLVERVNGQLGHRCRLIAYPSTALGAVLMVTHNLYLHDGSIRGKEWHQHLFRANRWHLSNKQFSLTRLTGWRETSSCCRSTACFIRRIHKEERKKE